MNNSLTQLLERKLGLFAVTSIVISNMIGAGIFTTSGLLMGDLKNPKVMVLLWMFGGMLALCGALSYGILGAAYPQAGGEYLFLSRLYHPLLGFLSGWVSFIAGFSAPIAASAIGFSEYFVRACPQVLVWGASTGFLSEASIKKILALVIIAGFTWIHLRGIEWGARIQSGLTLVEVALMVSLIVGGLIWGKGDFQHFHQGIPYLFNGQGWKTIGLSLMWIMFAYSGWNAATYIGAEIKNPGKNLPLSLILGTGLVMVFYVLLNLFYVFAIPAAEMKGVISIGGLAVRNLFGPSLEVVFSLLIAYALLVAVSAFILLGPRIYYSMARDRNFFDFAAELHPRLQIPAKAIFLQSLISMIMVLSGTFDQILTYLGFSLGIFPILAVLGVFRISGKEKRPSWIKGYPWAPVVYALVGTSMLGLVFLERPWESSIALLTVLTGVPAFFFFRWKKKAAR
jgi:basic amino acid/polyamine antiporter, APA family